MQQQELVIIDSAPNTEARPGLVQPNDSQLYIVDGKIYRLSQSSENAGNSGNLVIGPLSSQNRQQTRVHPTTATATTTRTRNGTVAKTYRPLHCGLKFVGIYLGIILLVEGIILAVFSRYDLNWLCIFPCILAGVLLLLSIGSLISRASA